MIWFWACSQRNESRSESRFGSRSASWLGSWFELRAFTSIANAVPITNRICEVIFCSYCAVCADWPRTAHISKMRTHESRSERALRSHVLRTRLSMRITTQNALYFTFQKRVSKAWFERALRSQRGKSGFKIRKGSESRSETASGTWFVPLWTGPVFNTTHIAHTYTPVGVLLGTRFDINSNEFPGAISMKAY